MKVHNSPVGPPELELRVEARDVSLEEGEVLGGVEVLRGHGGEERGLRAPLEVDPVPVGNEAVLVDQPGKVLQHPWKNAWTVQRLLGYCDTVGKVS